MVDVQPFFEKPPASVNDLRAGFGLDDPFRSGNFVTLHLYILRSNPTELRSDFDSLFLVNHSVMKNSRYGGLVGLGGVGVQNDVATLKPFLGEGLPFDLAHCTRARCNTFFGHTLRRQAHVRTNSKMQRT